MTSPALSQTVTHPVKSRLCVARIANSSGKPVAIERVQDQLIDRLKQLKVDAVAAPTITMLADHLELTSSNQGAMRALKCDSMLLTEVAESKASASGITVEFSVFDRGSRLLLHATIASTGSDPSQSASAALPAVSQKVATAVSSKKE
jgi:hypothetical protein